MNNFSTMKFSLIFLKFMKVILAFLLIMLIFGAISFYLWDRDIDKGLEALGLPNQALDRQIKKNLLANSSQLFFRINNPYPSIYPLEYVINQFDSGSWASCVDRSFKWDNYLDFSGKKKRKVFQTFTELFNVVEKTTVTIIGLYYSSDLESSIPNTNELRVIVFARHGTTKQSELCAQ